MRCSRLFRSGGPAEVWRVERYTVEFTMLDEQHRDPEDRIIDEDNERQVREKMLDKTIADSFPASDPASSLPDPDQDSFELIRSSKAAA